MESDSRSSNLVFLQGIRNDRAFTCDEGQGSDRQVSNGFQGPEDEKSNNNDSSSDQDPLAESIAALEREVLKIKEVGKDVQVDDSIADSLIKLKLEKLPSNEDGESSSNKDVERELDCFKQKFEAEVEYLVLSSMVQNLRVAVVDQISILEEQRTRVSDQTQIMDKLEGIENKAVMIEKESKKLESICNEIAIADETMKLQKKVFKYTSCLFLQVIVLVVILVVFISQLSLNYVEVVPT